MGVKIHETVKKEVFKYQPTEVRIHVINLSDDLKIEAEVIYDIDEYKVFITKKK